MQLDNDKKPRLRDKTQSHSAPYSIGEIPDSVMYAIGKQLVHRFAVGMADITGDDFGGIFAEAIGGEHRDTPLGIADVVWESCAWSIKTVKHKNPFKAGKIRVISGRNSPAYSFDMGDPFADVNETGEAVLSIWNERVNIARDEYDDLRMAVLIRDPNTKRYAIFEDEVKRFAVTEYVWALNKRKNLEGYSRLTGEHVFTWQPHGSQFTIIKPVSASALMFKIVKSVPVLEVREIMNLIAYQDNWIEKIPPKITH